MFTEIFLTRSELKPFFVPLIGGAAKMFTEIFLTRSELKPF